VTSLSVLIPSQGRESLRRAVRSAMNAGLDENDELIVVADTHEVHDTDALKQSILRMVANYRVPVRYMEIDTGHHCWGHCQLNHGLERASGQYVHCQDDDDIYTDGAIARMKQYAGKQLSPAPLLFRFRSYFGMVFWDRLGVATEGHIGGHCLLAPNNLRLGRFTCRYNGDFDYIASTLENYPMESMQWIDDVICHARPEGVPV
jgi:glycosyltransferase involved in cell wall biosynthesis